VCKDTITAYVGDKEVSLMVLPTYLVIHGSGWEIPPNPDGTDTYRGADNLFKELAIARNNRNKKEHLGGQYFVEYCPTDIEFFDVINKCENIVRLDVYSHGDPELLNLGGFMGNRKIRGVDCNVDYFWDQNSYGRDLRWVNINRTHLKSNDGIDYGVYEVLKDMAPDFYRDGNELENLKPNKFASTAEVYFWGCNIGGQLTLHGKHVLNVNIPGSSPMDSFAQKFAEQIGKGTVYALVGRTAQGEKGGSVFKSVSETKRYVLDGEMLPANVAENLQKKYKSFDNSKVKASEYLMGFSKGNQPAWKE